MSEPFWCGVEEKYSANEETFFGQTFRPVAHPAEDAVLSTAYCARRAFFRDDAEARSDDDIDGFGQAKGAVARPFC